MIAAELRSLTREELQQIVSAARSYSELAQAHNVSYAFLRKIVAERCIDTTHFNTCKFCSKIFERGQQVAGHVISCKQNPAIVVISKKRRAKQLGRSLATPTKQRLSEIAHAKVAAGTWHNSFAKRRKHAYGGAVFDGTWELKFARWCDTHGVRWIRNERSFPYFYGQQRRYTPDFYLPNIDCFVEIKGWAVARDQAKWSQFPERLLILRGEDLQALGIDIEVKQQKRY
jgi:hypothetical protein